jgi:hypothetical protein
LKQGCKKKRVVKTKKKGVLFGLKPGFLGFLKNQKKNIGFFGLI